MRAICAPLGSEGHSLAEPVWAVARKGKEAGKIVCEKVAARDTDHAAGDCRLEGDRFGNVTGVQALRGEGQPVIPIEEFIFARYMTVFDEPLGEAVYRPSYGPYWMRDTVRKLRIIHCEKKMAGMLIGTYQDDDDRPALDERLRAARSATWMSVPEGVRIEAVQLSTASEPDYKSLEESLRDEVVTGIAFGTLQMLTSTATGDQRGSADVQKMVTDLGPWLLMTIVTNAVNRQLFPKLIDFNYPYPAGGAYPKLTFGAVSNADLLELLQVVTGAKGLGLKPSRKHYAKTLSIQEADPNDPDDQLDDPNAMGGFGGMPPSDPTGGFDPTGGAPQGMPPTDPTAGGGYEGFSERAGWHAFNWQAAPTRGNSGVKAVWVGAGQRRPLYGAAARRALGRGTSAPAQAAPPSAPPSAPNPPSPPAPPGVTLPGPTAGPLPGPGEPAPRGRRVKRVGRAALTVGQRLTQAGAKVAQGVGYASKKIGQALQSLGWVERNLLFGAGRALERSGRRQIEQSRQTAAMARDGRLGAAARRATRAVVGAAGVKWVENRRRYGFVAATVMEAAFWALKLGPAAVGAGLAAGALTGSLGVATVAGVSAAAVAKAVLGPALTPVLRSLIAMPFRRGRGKRGANAPQRKLARQIRRAAKKGVPFSPPAGTAPEVVAKARELAATSSDPGRALYTPGRKTSRRRFSEAAAFAEGGDPFDLVVAARDTIDELSAAGGDAPPDLSDDQLSALLAELFEYVEGLADDSGERVQAFAERHGAGAAWERFGWQAGRTRTQSVKAIGTGPDAGKTLYGANARAALARSAGASKRQDAPRAVSYDVTDGEGNVARKRETNVSPERARAMAVAAQLAATEPVTGPRPTQLRVTKDRKPKAIADAESRLESAAARVATGDPAAAKEIGEHGKATTDLAAKEIAAVPAPPPAVQAKIRGAWARAAKGMGATEAKQLGSMVGELARGFDSDAAAAGRWAGKVAGFVGKLSYGTAKLAVKGLARFAKFGLRAAGGAARLAYRGAKAVVGSDTARPFLYWAAAMTAGAALVAAPALAVSAGLVKFSVGLGLAAPSVAASVYVMRKIGRRAADAGLELKGEGFLVPRSAAERMSEALGGPLDALFGAAAGRLVEAFAWDDWRQDGERWKSPGGRYLSDAAYQRMKGRASGGNRGETPQTVSPRSGSADGRGPAAPAKRFAPPAAPQPGRVYQVDPTRIAVDPGRFQFKLNTDPSGVTTHFVHGAEVDLHQHRNPHHGRKQYPPQRD